MVGDVAGMKARMKSGQWDANAYAVEEAGTAWTPEDQAQASFVAMDRRTANKRTYTAEEATERRRQMAQSAGSGTLEAGLVVARNNEVLEVKSTATVPVPAGVSLVVAAATAQSTGSEFEVPCAVEWLERAACTAPTEEPATHPPPPKRRSFYALLSGHGSQGLEVSQWVSSRLPVLLAGRLEGVAANESGAIKEAIKASFEACNAELLLAAPEHGWEGGCAALGLLLDLHAAPPRAYVASLGSSQGYVCVKEEGSSVTKSVAVSKCKPGRYFGHKPASLAAAATAGVGGAGGGAAAVLPDVTSFDVKAAQRFVVLGSAPMWRCANGQLAVELLASRLHMMDARRAEIKSMLADDTRLAIQGAGKVLCMCMCAYVHVCMCACVHVCMCACACVHVCMCACVHLRILWRACPLERLC